MCDGCSRVQTKYQLIDYIQDLGYTTSLLFSEYLLYQLASKIVLLILIHLFVKLKNTTFILLNTKMPVKYDIENTIISIITIKMILKYAYKIQQLF